MKGIIEMRIKPMYWVLMPDQSDMGEGILRIETEKGIPLNVCVYYDTDYKSIVMGEFAEFDFVLMAQTIEIFKDEDDFRKNGDGLREAESLIPSGMINIAGDADFKESPTALMSGKVSYIFDSAEYGVPDDTSLLNVDCLGMTWDVMVERSNTPCGEIEMGNVISGVFMFIGGLSEAPGALN